MKYIVAIIFLLLINISSHGQRNKADSLYNALTNEKVDSNRIDILWKLSGIYTRYKLDSALYLSHQSLLLSRKIKDVKREAYALKQMAEAYQNLGNYPESLRYYLERLKLDEKSKNPDRQVVTLLSIANLYQLQTDYRHALEYAKRGNALIELYKLKNLTWYGFMVFGEMYEKMNDIPNASKYNNLAYDFAIAKNDSAWIGMCLNNTGNTFAKAGKIDEAFNYYRHGIPYLVQSNNQDFLCETYLSIGKIKLEKNELDSASYYAKRSLQTAEEGKFIKKYMLACELLTDIFRTKNLSDSALVYQSRLLLIKDSISSEEKVRQVESMTITEELRQKEIEEKRLLEQKEVKRRLDLLLVGLLIPIFFFICMFLSRRKISPRIVETLGVISLLILFEYITLWLHPFIAEVSGHSPLYEIAILVALAAFLTPAHHRLERWLKHRLTSHKHKKEAAFQSEKVGKAEPPQQQIQEMRQINIEQSDDDTNNEYLQSQPVAEIPTVEEKPDERGKTV